MYKDKDKQREASKEAMRRHRAKKQGITNSQPKGTTKVDNVIPTYDYDVIPGEKVYGRQAVIYSDIAEANWPTRPEPLSPEDYPKPYNRGKYIRPDGSEYQFDATGQVHECENHDGEPAKSEGMVAESEYPYYPDIQTKPLIEDSQIPSAVVRPKVARDGSCAGWPGNCLAFKTRLAHWQDSQAYAEVFYRLTHWSLEKLRESGQFIPVWREALE
jgi:hypothetical protein